jgi:hypothetical protein
MLSFSPFLVELLDDPPEPPADLEPEPALDPPVLFEELGGLSP